MAKKRTKKTVTETEVERPTDRHKQHGKLVRMNARLWDQLGRLVEQNATDVSTEFRIAIRERLERAGLWPPPAEE